jgi:oxygen-independent coproporphyrinogen-3 oxidase
LAGIYIHIPFCRKRCYYCDFYKTTDFGHKFRLLKSLNQELKDRASELSADQVDTVYLGGGTPSVLKVDELKQLLDTVGEHFRLEASAEITLEVNPDDVSEAKVRKLHQAGYNRLSIGIQSFSEGDLQRMNRRHDVRQAVDSVKIAKQAGFENISIDLIYGLPDQSPEDWKRNLDMAVGLEVQHLSAYHLTYHEGTLFYDLLKKGHLNELSDEQSLLQFGLLVERLKSAGFEQYEISNFCQPGFHSRHNSSYWEGVKYLGIGPSAHSFDLKSRRWNVASVLKYMNGIETGRPVFGSEVLTVQDRYNDRIITGLRTSLGISQKAIEQEFPEKYTAHFQKIKARFQESGHLTISGENVRLNLEGFFISDKIIADFMVVE